MNNEQLKDLRDLHIELNDLYEDLDEFVWTDEENYLQVA